MAHSCRVCELKELNVFKMKCLKSRNGVYRLDRFNSFKNIENLMRENRCEERIGCESDYSYFEIVWSCKENGK